MTTTHLLWTGGWDSTFRLLDLLLVKHATVQPYYVIHPRRMSSPWELHAAARIRTEAVARWPECRSFLLPTVLADQSTFSPDPNIAQALGRLRSHQGVGWQYSWLACFAKQVQAPLELAIHKDDRAHALLKGAVVREYDARGSYYKLIDGPPHSDLELFRPFRFPLFDLTKRDMLAIARSHGFADLLTLTWFCFTPRNGTPCGTCAPCVYAQQEGLGWRIPLTRRLHRVSRGIRRRLLGHLPL